MFQRGFKTSCEQTAIALRRQQLLHSEDPLCPRSVAKEKSIAIVTPSELPLLKAVTRQRLLTIHANCWSALTIPASPPLIIINPTHSAGRQNSDLMHELAHVLLDHVGSKTYIDPKTGLMLRSYDAAQEEEANWLAGCLLLPREALLRVKSMKLSNEEAMNEYGVSQEMLRFRMNVSGVNIQHRRSQVAVD